MNIKITSQQLIILFAWLFTFNSFAQDINSVKKFDFSLLEGKVLLIPTYQASATFIAKMKKKGKYQDISDAKSKAAHYNKIWKEAMAESSYDATDYEIKAFNSDKLVRTKNKTALLLYYYKDSNTNKWAKIISTSPRKQIVASALINGLDLSDKNDIRLMMNLLNDSMNQALEVKEDGQKTSKKGMKNKTNQRLANFYDNMKDKTLLIPKVRHINPKKEKAKNTELKATLENWKLSNYKITTKVQIEEERSKGNPDTFYWRAFPYWVSPKNPGISRPNTYFNVLLSSDGDKVIFKHPGKEQPTPSVFKKIQTKIIAKVERYKKQLENN